MYFTDETLFSCTEISLTSLRDTELSFQNKVISYFLKFLYPLLLRLIILIQVLKISILVLNFRIQHPRNSEPLKYPFLGHKRSKT